MLQTIWLPQMSSGAPALDHLHQAFIEALKNASAAADSEFCARYLTLTERSEHIFRQEDQWMDAIDFAGAKAHREQHARVLAALHNTRLAVLQGDLALGRRMANVLLPHWFAFHLATMDTALAFALQIAKTEGMQDDLRDETCAITL
jgi:hemerythrin-like metal-binding protein